MILCIIIVDDYFVVWIGIKVVIEISGVGCVVVEVSIVEELMWVLLFFFCDVLVIDYLMFGGQQVDGFVMIGMICCCFLDLLVLMFSVFNNLVILWMVKFIGVFGLVDKVFLMEELLLVIQIVQCGILYVSCMLKECIDVIGMQSVDDEGYKEFLFCEVEVLCLFGIGFIVKEIVLQLYKSVSIISCQKGDVMLKFGLKGDVELFDYLCDGYF